MLDELDGSTMIVYRLFWDSRCADCRALLRSGTTGNRVHVRLLCQECLTDVEWTEAEVAHRARKVGTSASLSARPPVGGTPADWAMSAGSHRGIGMDRSRG